MNLVVAICDEWRTRTLKPDPRCVGLFDGDNVINFPCCQLCVMFSLLLLSFYVCFNMLSFPLSMKVDH